VSAWTKIKKCRVKLAEIQNYSTAQGIAFVFVLLSLRLALRQAIQDLAIKKAHACKYTFFAY